MHWAGDVFGVQVKSQFLTEGLAGCVVDVAVVVDGFRQKILNLRSNVFEVFVLVDNNGGGMRLLCTSPRKPLYACPL
jgi:hypothetical protein